jgi:hypothetical protein
MSKLICEKGIELRQAKAATKRQRSYNLVEVPVQPEQGSFFRLLLNFSVFNIFL